MARILLVDDEESVLQSVGLLLRSEEHDVVSMRDSGEAAEAIKAECFDLLITDIRMVPIDGMELLRIAHARWPDMPMIVISAYTSERTAQLTYELGCKAYINKPFRIEELLEAVRQALA